MRKLLFVFTVTVLCMFLGCIVEREYTVTYIYDNRCSTEITVKSHSPIGTTPGKDSIFMIPRAGQHELVLITDGGFYPPLRWGEYNSSDSTVVTNGDKQIVYKLRENGAIYFPENYQLVKDGKYNRTYKFTFTDADFADAEPVNP